MISILYGIPNCDSVRQARKWLDGHSIPYRFHDFRRDGLTERELEHWLNTLNLEELVNRRSMSWGKLDTDQRNMLSRGISKNTITILLQHPTLIKRPLLEWKEGILIGFNAKKYQQLIWSKNEPL